MLSVLVLPRSAEEAPAVFVCVSVSDFFSYLQKLAHFNIEMKGTSDKMLWWCEVKRNNSDCSRRNLLSPQRQAQSENTLIKIWVGRENCAIPYCVEYG